MYRARIPAMYAICLYRTIQDTGTPFVPNRSHPKHLCHLHCLSRM